MPTKIIPQKSKIQNLNIETERYWPSPAVFTVNELLLAAGSCEQAGNARQARVYKRAAVKRMRRGRR